MEIYFSGIHLLLLFILLMIIKPFIASTSLIQCLTSMQSQWLHIGTKYHHDSLMADLHSRLVNKTIN